MSSVQSEYRRFLDHLEGAEVPDDVRRLANLVGLHSATLQEYGTVRRARSTRLVPLVEQHLDATPLRLETEQQQHVAAPIGRLHQLRVGPFRGFMREETFDLDRDITLLYGANGTGKSSFCEALETAMLGSISEANAKRIDLRMYCNNARLRRHTVPTLTSQLATGDVLPVSPNEAEFRFCFVEKCRLDDFARIAARTPADQRQLIATLFGVEAFAEFVRGFNTSLDESLILHGPKALTLQSRRSQLAASEQIIAVYPTREAEILEQNRELAQRVFPGSTFQSCIDWIFGNNNQVGRLAWLQAQIDAPPPVIHGMSQPRLATLLSNVYSQHQLWQATANQLNARTADVSYAKLYAAVLELAQDAGACPACGTGLEHTVANPFHRARAGLEQLGEIALLQTREQQQLQDLDHAWQGLHSEMARALTIARTVCPDDLASANLPQLPVTHQGQWLNAWVLGTQDQPWNRLLNVVSAIERLDAAAREALAARETMIQERTRLEGYRAEIERQKTLLTTACEARAAAQRTVAEFEEANKTLIAEVATEALVVAHHHRIKAAYDAYLPALQAYTADLPARLLQGLALKARDLYNAFNRGDAPGDLLHALILPVAENGKIEIEFASEPGVRYDALIVLSEGHIKCLGLAILVAKNVSLQCPVIIFDDIVNAIDDDHRDGILRTLFEDGHLEGKQVILTSHAQEFLHRIQQELGSARAHAIKSYKFLPHDGSHELVVDTNPPTKNYVLLAQQAIGADERRDALRFARPGLESVTDRLWKWLPKYGDARLDIKFTGPNGHLELHNKCLKLRKALEGIKDRHNAIPTMIEAMDRVLRDGNSVEWQYLNGGVHDSTRPHEFDRAVTRTIVQALADMDTTLDALRERAA